MTSSRTLSRTSLAALGAGIALLVSSIAPATASPARHSKPVKPDQPVVAGSRYLALGDSVSFGFREDNAIPKPHVSKPKSIIGFPEDIAKNLGLKLTNAACPGETTASFLATSAQSNGCENHYDGTATPAPGGYRTINPLHVSYKSSSQSQLAFAQAYLKKYPKTRLITIMIGANDAFLCLQSTTDGCTSEFGTLLKHISKNVTKIMKGLRGTAHYTGQIALLTYYSTNYTDPVLSGETSTLNNAIVKAAKPYDVRVADGYGEFNKAAKQARGDTCKAQLLTALSGADKGTCGVHPSIAGQALLAQAVEKVLKK
jgi:lysophospholipase L1-like esterase